MTSFIPQYEEVFKHVLARYHEDFRKEGAHSYDYKVESGRTNEENFFNRTTCNNN